MDLLWKLTFSSQQQPHGTNNQCNSAGSYICWMMKQCCPIVCGEGCLIFDVYKSGLLLLWLMIDFFVRMVFNYHAFMKSYRNHCISLERKFYSCSNKLNEITSCLNIYLVMGGYKNGDKGFHYFIKKFVLLKFINTHINLW